MAWHSILDQDQLTLKLDDEDKAALLEVNDGGISPNYVTVRLKGAEIDALMDALQRIKASIQ
ncbi:hypothetical protein FU659_02900 [Paenibacillus sp. N3.4]|nr:hypothetical protein FU659_02900 [Paenibacillus sp. N3.4]